MKRVALALLLLVGAIAAGCGGEGSQSSSTARTAPTATGSASTPSASSANAIVQAGQTTSAETSARVSFKATFTGDTSGTMTGEGVFSRRQGHLTMDLGGLTSVGTGQAEIVFDKLVYYMKLPAGSGASLPPGKEWFKLDFAKLGKQQGLDLSQLMQLNQSDPSQALDFLQGASDDFEEVGQEQVRGGQTTHYKGTIDLQKVAEEAPADVQEQYRELAELSGNQKVPMDVWIGDDGLVRKIAFTQAVPNGGSVKMEEEFYDFGTEEQVEVPSDDEVVDLTALLGEQLMDVALKIWRFDPETGERALKAYEVEAPEWACLLDVLDIIKDQVDGTLGYRKSCRMMICGSCGMRMDGRAVLACRERMKPIVERGHVPVISAMGNMPVLKDLVVDMTPFWAKVRNMKPWLDTGYEEVPEKEFRYTQEQMNPIHKEALCIMCGCCVSECNSMESDPEFFGPAALAKGFRFVGDPRERGQVERLEHYNDEHGIWDCTRCYFCNERCPKGVDPRDSIAKLGAESIKYGIDRDMGAKHAKWFVRSAMTTGWLRETELVPKTQGVIEAVRQTKFALKLAKHGKVPIPVPPHVADRVQEARALYEVVKAQGRDGAAGIVQSERALGSIEHTDHGGARRDAPEVTPGETPPPAEG